jgi:hypothetical protein
VREVKPFCGVWVELLQCCARRAVYNWETKTGVLVLPPEHCTDMRGAIAFFERIDPAVELILTGSDDCPDTRYERSGMEWRAIVYGRAEPK